MPRWRLTASGLALAGLWLAAPGAGGPAPASAAGAGGHAPPTTSAPRPQAAAAPSGRRELIVFEAASLKDAFARLGAAFEKEHAGVEVVTNAAGSQELRAQIEHGAPADVFASADRKHMDALVSAGLATVPSVFACNELVIVVRPALAATVKTLADLPGVERIVVGAPDVPVGAYTQQVLTRAAAKLGPDFPKRVETRIVSRELNVRQVLAKVVLGEADAGVVYRSDAVAARGKVAVVPIAAELNVVAEYPIAVLAAAPHAELGRRWIELVKSPTGAAALRDAGFMPCPMR